MSKVVDNFDEYKRYGILTSSEVKLQSYPVCEILSIKQVILMTGSVQLANKSSNFGQSCKVTQFAPSGSHKNEIESLAVK
jgi:hypothetical protein